MIKSIVLTNEQAITLYNLLQNKKLDRAKNRNRWKFLEVIEKDVFAYEDQRDEESAKANQLRQEVSLMQADQRITYDEKVKKQKEVVAVVKKIQEDIKELSKQTYTFNFNDREIFAQGQAIFEMLSADPATPEELTGQESKIVKQIEDAFLNAKESQATQATPAQTTEKGVN